MSIRLKKEQPYSVRAVSITLANFLLFRSFFWLLFFFLN